MKIAIFEKRTYETEIINNFAQNNNIEIVTTDEKLDENTVKMCENAIAITTLGFSNLDKNLLDKIKKSGVKYIATRTIGHNHIDVNYAKEIGLKVCNVTYAPNGVADFTVMLMLLALRKYKPAMWRQNVNDYTLNGLMGKEIRNLTVGVLGTGRIGQTVIKNLTGFGCKLIASDKFENENIKKIAEYVDTDTLLKESDIITIHMPLNEENNEFINKSTISKMKKGVVIINTARAELMNIPDIIKGIESEQIGSLAMDVFQNENEIYHHNRSTDIIKNRDMAYLRQFPNVILTQHMAFFTESAVEEMITNTLDNILSFIKTDTCKNEI